MSIANEHPEEIPDTTPRYSEDIPREKARNMLKDFLAWLRAEKGYRICTKEGSTPGGKPLYEQVFRKTWAEAADEFMDRVNEIPPPYRGPRPLVHPGEKITRILDENKDSGDSHVDGLFEELPY